MRKLILQAEDLGKYYGLYGSPLERMSRLLWKRSQQHGFWALRHVSFNVAAGESFAIIGRNGGGKSTLLQMIAGVLQPTEGSLQVHGKVAALLELGSGFHPEFTGRDNVMLSGAILGLGRDEILGKFDEIISFFPEFFRAGRINIHTQTPHDPDIRVGDSAVKDVSDDADL